MTTTIIIISFIFIIKIMGLRCLWSQKLITMLITMMKMAMMKIMIMITIYNDD